MAASYDARHWPDHYEKFGVHCVDRSVLSPEPHERFHDSNFEIENVPEATDEDNFFVGDISE